MSIPNDNSHRSKGALSPSLYRPTRWPAHALGAWSASFRPGEFIPEGGMGVTCIDTLLLHALYPILTPADCP